MDGNELLGGGLSSPIAFHVLKLISVAMKNFGLDSQNRVAFDFLNI